MSNNGYTMVETIVGFTLMSILMIMFIGCIRLGSSMLMESTDRIEAGDEFRREFYKKDALDSAVNGENEYLSAERVTDGLYLYEINADGDKNGTELKLSGEIYRFTDRAGDYGYGIYRLVGER